jgi:hypothetical protein
VVKKLHEGISLRHRTVDSGFTCQVVTICFAVEDEDLSFTLNIPFLSLSISSLLRAFDTPHPAPGWGCCDACRCFRLMLLTVAIPLRSSPTKLMHTCPCMPRLRFLLLEHWIELRLDSSSCACAASEMEDVLIS